MKKTFIVFALMAVSLVSVAQQLQYDLPAGANPRYGMYEDRVSAPGAVFYVDSGNSNASDITSRGHSPNLPFATLDYAIGRCTASANDVIYVMPGHNEGGTAADLFDVDVAGVTIIGLGEGALRPRFDFDDTDVTVAIGAASVTLKNLTFLPSASAVVSGIIIEAAGTNALIEDCEFLVGEAAGTDEFVVTIQVSTGANDATIINNTFRTAITDTHCTSAINLGLGGAIARANISGNDFYGNWSTAAIIDGVTAVTEVLIANNQIKVKDGEPGIELHANTTGSIANNNIASSGVTCSASIVAADGEWFNNYCVTTDGAAAVPIGLDSVTDVSTTLANIGATVDEILTDTGTTLPATLAGITATQVNHGATLDEILTDTGTTLPTTLAGITATLALHGTTMDAIETKIDLMATATAIGTEFTITCVLDQASIVSTGVALTGASSGTLRVIGVTIQNGGTEFDSSTDGAVLEIYSNNADGSGSFYVTTEASLTAGVVLDMDNAATSASSVVIENGKIVSIKATTEDFTSDGHTTYYIHVQRITAAATAAAGATCL